MGQLYILVILGLGEWALVEWYGMGIAGLEGRTRWRGRGRP